ncbi:hypothetical protein Pmani_026878 [Petrolisthes manimaculis]|uniref:Trans-Golgi network integral membrane protein 2 n=1 Tax=Petrolisthes manimaculis TaxID=1843537 RepID=A0AAE1TXE1_9EUCA|nr:hypothetical protein Pmani_026878 [Petrolisthes manimaculis]
MKKMTGTCVVWAVFVLLGALLSSVSPLPAPAPPSFPSFKLQAGSSYSSQSPQAPSSTGIPLLLKPLKATASPSVSPPQIPRQAPSEIPKPPEAPRIISEPTEAPKNISEPPKKISSSPDIGQSGVGNAVPISPTDQQGGIEPKNSKAPAPSDKINNESVIQHSEKLSQIANLVTGVGKGLMNGTSPLTLNNGDTASGSNKVPESQLSSKQTSIPKQEEVPMQNKTTEVTSAINTEPKKSKEGPSSNNKKPVSVKATSGAPSEEKPMPLPSQPLSPSVNNTPEAGSLDSESQSVIVPPPKASTSISTTKTTPKTFVGQQWSYVQGNPDDLDEANYPSSKAIGRNNYDLGADSNLLENELEETEPRESLVPQVVNGGKFSDDEDSHFFAYFLTIMVTAIIFYLVFHNKQRIIALIIEGRAPSSRGRRNSSRAKYHKLDNNLEEAMSVTKGNKYDRIY